MLHRAPAAPSQTNLFACRSSAAAWLTPPIATVVPRLTPAAACPAPVLAAAICPCVALFLLAIKPSVARLSESCWLSVGFESNCTAAPGRKLRRRVRSPNWLRAL